jgi:gas vesicle protein
MAREPSRTADELTTAIRSLIDKALDARTREEIAARGRELAATIADTAGTAAERASVAANDAWRDSASQRKQAAKQARRMSGDALKWSRRQWIKRLQPTLRKTWDKRVVAGLGAAGIAVPASKEIAAQTRRLGITRREEHGWRMFFLGALLGAIGGVIVALLTAPRPGREMRDELATRAREAANSAGDWVPLFQREAVPEGATSRAESPSEPTAAIELQGSETSAVADQISPARSTRRSKGNGAEPGVDAPLPEIADESEQETI